MNRELCVLAVCAVLSAGMVYAGMVQVPISAETCEITYSTSHSSYPGTKLYDGLYGNDGGVGRWLAGAKGEAWVTAHFKDGSTYAPNYYTVVGLNLPNFATRDPKAFKLEASASGEDGSWTVLDSRTDQIDWVEAEERSFSFANSTGYSWFRFVITENNGWTEPASYTGAGELKLFVAENEPPSDKPVAVAPESGATGVGSIAILRWKSENKGVSYVVYCGLDAELGEEDILLETSETSATASGLLPDANYHWRVEARNPYGKVLSDVFTFSTRSTDSGLYLYEGFNDYAAGVTLKDASGGTGPWDSAWWAPSAYVTVVDKDMAYTNKRIRVSGGGKALQIDSYNADPILKRTFKELDNPTVYMSLLIRTEVVHTTGARKFGLFLQPRDALSTSRLGFLFQHPDNTFAVDRGSASPTYQSTGITVEAARTYFVVLRLRRRVYATSAPYYYADLLLDPSSAKEPDDGWFCAEGNSGAETLSFLVSALTDTSDVKSAPRFIDELRIGPTYESVVPLKASGMMLIVK